MINEDRWINSLPNPNKKFDSEKNLIDGDKWVETISKRNTYSSVKKYSLLSILFVSGLLLVSVLKNETRNLQKEINNLETSINLIKFNLNQAILDNEVITSPENISLLAKEHLNMELTPYERSQIRHIDSEIENFEKLAKLDKKKLNKKKNNLPESIKLEVAKKIEKKRTEIRKLQQLYSSPKEIPNEIKMQVAKKIKEKRNELQNMYNSPQEIFTSEKLQRWGAVQIVKVFLGMPIIPGR